MPSAGVCASGGVCALRLAATPIAMRTNRFICRSPFLRQRPFECDPHVSVTGDTKHDTPVLIAWARAGRDADLFGIGWLNEDGDTGQVPGDGSGTGLTVVDRDEIGSL